MNNSPFNEEFIKKIELLYIISKKLFQGKLKAKRKTKKVASGIEFADHRKYTPGDDFRNIDWKIYARSEKLLLRLFEEKEDLNVYGLIDTSLSMAYGNADKFLHAKKILAALSYIALANMDNLSLVAFNEKLSSHIPPTRGKGQIFKVFNFLDNLKSSSETSIEEACKNFVSQNKRRGIAILISDLYNPNGFKTALNILHHQKFEVYLIHIKDENDRNPKLHGDLELIDCETQQRLPLTITKNLLNQYQKIYDNYCLDCEAYCTQRNMLYIPAPVQIPFDEIVLNIFKNGGSLT